MFFILHINKTHLKSNQHHINTSDTKSPNPKQNTPRKFNSQFSLKPLKKWVGGTGVDSRRLEPASELGVFAVQPLEVRTAPSFPLLQLGGRPFFFQWTKGGVGHATGFGAENRNKQKQLKLSIDDGSWLVIGVFLFLISVVVLNTMNNWENYPIVGWICLSGWLKHHWIIYFSSETPSNHGAGRNAGLFSIRWKEEISISHRIHGTGIFTYMKTIKIHIPYMMGPYHQILWYTIWDHL